MNGLVSKCFVLITFVLVGVFQEILAETIQIGFRLPMYPQSDRDISLMQKFLLAQAFAEMDSETKETYSFILSYEGELIIEGEQETIYFFADALGKAIEKVIRKEKSKEAFQIQKEKYLASSEDLLENALIEEIQQEALLEAGTSLQPLAKMLCTAASVVSENLSLTLVSDSSQQRHFYSLPMSQTDQKSIYELIESMGSLGYLGLLRKKKKMEKLGDKVHHVHPLRFIGYIYSHPYLKNNMGKIMGDILKRRGFLNGHWKREGFAQRMTKEMNHNNLIHYIPGFAQSVGVDENEISRFFHRHNWKGLLYYLNKKLLGHVMLSRQFLLLKHGEESKRHSC